MEETVMTGDQPTVVVVQQVKSQEGPVMRGPQTLYGDRQWTTSLCAVTEDCAVCERSFTYRKTSNRSPRLLLEQVT